MNHYENLVGRTYKSGKIVGITPAPKLGYPAGFYAVVTFFDKPLEYIPVDEIYASL